MKKRIAVLVRDRQAEALRMAVGLTLEDDEVTVFIMDRKLEETGSIAINLEALKEMGAEVLSNNPENAFEIMSTGEIARALVTYDTVLPY